jgi:hypothetical protein
VPSSGSVAHASAGPVPANARCAARPGSAAARLGSARGWYRSRCLMGSGRGGRGSAGTSSFACTSTTKRPWPAPASAVPAPRAAPRSARPARPRHGPAATPRCGWSTSPPGTDRARLNRLRRVVGGQDVQLVPGGETAPPRSLGHFRVRVGRPAISHHSGIGNSQHPVEGRCRVVISPSPPSGSAITGRRVAHDSLAERAGSQASHSRPDLRDDAVSLVSPRRSGRGSTSPPDSSPQIDLFDLPLFIDTPGQPTG